MPDQEPPPDDRSIDGDARLIRAVSRVRWIVDDGAGGLRVASGAFQDVTDAEGIRGMSVLLEQTLEELGLDYRAVAAEFSDHALVVVTAEVVRDCGLGVIRAPISGPIGGAHGHVLGKKTPGRQSRLARECERLVWP